MKWIVQLPSEDTQTWWAHAWERHLTSPVSLALFAGKTRILAFDDVAARFVAWARTVPGYQEGMFCTEGSGKNRESPMSCPCECGGKLEPVTLDGFDFSAYAGLPVWIKQVDGLSCHLCGGQTLEGGQINRILENLATSLLQEPATLSLQEATFLRKRMRMSQSQLADAMCQITGKAKSSHDILLRVLFVVHIFFDQLFQPLRESSEF